MQDKNRLVFTVQWQVREGAEQQAADIIARFLPEARKEPGLELLTINQRADDASQFLFYEVFANAAAFDAHQQTPHFKTLILGQALPLLSKRERTEWKTM